MFALDYQLPFAPAHRSGRVRSAGMSEWGFARLPGRCASRERGFPADRVTEGRDRDPGLHGSVPAHGCRRPPLWPRAGVLSEAMHAQPDASADGASWPRVLFDPCGGGGTGIEGKSRVKIRGGSGTAFPVILRSAAQFVAKAEPVRQGICVQEPEARCDDENPNCQPEPEPVHLCVAGAACGQLFST